MLPALARLPLAAAFGLSEDEAYYWEWSRRLDWSFLDQGAGVALAIRAGTALFGHTALGVRAPGVALQGGALLCAFLLLRRMYGRRAAIWGAVLLNLIPLFAVSAVLMLHESVQAFFWSLGMLAAWSAIGARGGARALGAWLAVGLCVGLGFNGKYTMLLFAPALLGVLLAAEHRRWLARPHPYLAGLVALAAAAPVVYWNQLHDWPSLRRVGWLALRPGGPVDPLAPLELLGTQLVAVSPLLFALMLWRLGAAWREGVRGADARARFMFAFSVAYVAPFFALSPFTKVYANWPGLGYLPAALLLAAWVAARERQPGFAASRAGRFWWAGLGLAAATTAVLYLHLGARVLPLPGHLDPAKRFYGWRELGHWASGIAAEYAAQGTPLHYYARTYQIAALLAFYVPGQPTVYEVKSWTPGRGGTQYDYWEDLPPGADALLVVHRDQAVPAITHRSFASVVPLPERTLEIERFGGVAQRFRAYLCRDYWRTRSAARPGALRPRRARSGAGAAG